MDMYGGILCFVFMLKRNYKRADNNWLTLVNKVKLKVYYFVVQVFGDLSSVFCLGSHCKVLNHCWKD